MEIAAKADRALAQLVAAAGHQRRQAGSGCAFAQGQRLVAKTGAAVGVGEQHHLVKRAHGILR